MTEVRVQGLSQQYLDRRNVAHARDLASAVANYYLAGDDVPTWRVQAAVNILRATLARLERALELRGEV